MRMTKVLVLALLIAGCTRSSQTASTTAAAGGAADTLDVYVAATTDVHGWIRGWDYFANRPDSTRGLARAATLIDSLREAHPGRVVLVDAGDDLQGSPITTAPLRDSLLPNPVISAMNVMRYDAAVIGNHEFNFGLPFLHRAIAQATFPMVAANVYTPDGRHAYVPWTMLRRGDARIAVIGGTTPGTMIWDRDKVQGRIEVRDILPSVRAAVDAARRASADVVVALLHSGLGEPSSYDTAATRVASENVAARVAREIPGIDLVVFGHSHREVADTTIAGVLLTQPRNWAGSVSVARLTLRREAGKLRVAAKSARTIPVRGRAEHAAVVAAVDTAHARTVAFINSPIAQTAESWSADSSRVKDTPIIDFVLEVMRRNSGADLASTAAFNLNADFGPGAITIADMAELYTYENNVLRVVRISGQQLRDYLEFSARYFRQAVPGNDSLVDHSVPGFNFDIVAGVDYVIDISRPVGSRITSLTREGRAVQPTDSFTLALNDYRQAGGGGYTMLNGSPLVSSSDESIRQLLIDAARERGTLRSADYFRRNWRLEPADAADRVYRSMRRLPFDRPRR